MRAEDVVQALSSPELRRHVEEADLSAVLHVVALLDGPRLGLLATWLEDLMEAVGKAHRLRGQQPERVWKLAVAFGAKLPELKKLKALEDRIKYVWYKERPGTLPQAKGAKT